MAFPVGTAAWRGTRGIARSSSTRLPRLRLRLVSPAGQGIPGADLHQEAARCRTTRCWAVWGKSEAGNWDSGRTLRSPRTGAAYSSHGCKPVVARTGEPSPRQGGGISRGGRQPDDAFCPLPSPAYAVPPIQRWNPGNGSGNREGKAAHSAALQSAPGGAQGFVPKSMRHEGTARHWAV